MPEEQSNQSNNSSVENKEEERRKRIKVLTILLLLLLLALLFLFFLYYLLFAPKKTVIKGKGIEFLFSIYGFNRPLGVSTDVNGDIYVSDTGNNKFLVFDSTGDFKKRIGTNKGVSRIYGVYGSFVDDKEKKVYIADWTFRAIHVFNLDGKFLYRFPPDPLNGEKYGDLGFTPYDVDLYKGRLYVSSNDGVYIFTKRGMFSKYIGEHKRSKEPGSYDFPNGVLVSKKDGSIYVADVLNRRIVALTSKGNIKWILGKSDVEGKIVSYFGLPRSIAEDKNGRLYITDTFRHLIVILDKNGKLISEVGDRGVEDGKFNFPEGIAITSEGVIYVDDRENNRLQAIRINSLPKPSGPTLKKHKDSLKKF